MGSVFKTVGKIAKPLAMATPVGIGYQIGKSLLKKKKKPITVAKKKDEDEGTAVMADTDKSEDVAKAASKRVAERSAKGGRASTMLSKRKRRVRARPSDAPARAASLLGSVDDITLGG